ncbi:unnamed protein product [Rhodiola kirilowii]
MHLISATTSINNLTVSGQLKSVRRQGSMLWLPTIEVDVRAIHTCLEMMRKAVDWQRSIRCNGGSIHENVRSGSGKIEKGQKIDLSLHL